jgi:hypothetical protein
LAVQAGLGKKQDPVSKIIRTERTAGMAQVVEYLPHKCASWVQKLVPQGAGEKEYS